METDIKNLEYGKKIVRNSIFLLIVLTLIKAFGGYVTNMVVLLGDAAGSFVDLIAQIAIFIGLTLSLRPPDKRFKYGYHRIETLISLLIALLIIFVGYKILLEAIYRLQNPAETHLISVGIVAAIISIILSVFAYVIQKKTAEKINSSALMTSAVDKRNDAVVSAGVLGGVIANALNIPYVENAIGIFVALAVLFAGLKAAKEAVFYLLDYWDNPQIAQQINRILSHSKLITAVKKIRLRHAGTFNFGEAFVEINPFAEMTDVRDEVHRLNTEIKEQVPHLGDFGLYVDPPKPDKMRVAIPVTDDKGLQSKIAEKQSDSFHFVILEIFNRKIQAVEAYPKEKFTIAESAILAHFLKEHRVNILIANNIQALLFFTLRLTNIKVYPHFGNVKDIEHTVKLLLLDIA